MDDAELMRVLGITQNQSTVEEVVEVIPAEEPVIEAIKEEYFCEYCSRQFNSQNGVNSHLRYCSKKGEKKEAKVSKRPSQKNSFTAPLNPFVPNAAEERQARREAAEARRAERKTKVKVEPPKPKKIYNPPTDEEIRDLVVKMVKNNPQSIILSTELYTSHRKSVIKEFGKEAYSALESYEGRVTAVLKKIQKTLGVNHCLGMAIAGDDSYQLALFVDTTRINLDNALKGV
jgi:predicted transcriptional regulator